MNAVGIDVSKGKSVVSVLRPFGEIVAKPFTVSHTGRERTELAVCLKSLDGETRVIMEHTGRYYEPVAQFLCEAGLFVSAVNPKLIKDYGNNSLRKVKTDKADSRKIARYGLDNWTELRQHTPMDMIRYQLKTLNRQRALYAKTKTMLKNNLIALLDQTYPGVNALFESPVREDGSQKWVDFAASFWHLDCVRRRSLKGFTEQYRNLTAFAGVDPGVNQSGSHEARSVHTSRSGPPELRKTLFLVMDCLLKTAPSDDPVFQFMDKKRAEGKPYLVYMTAGANKFLRVYYGRVRESLGITKEN